jgi:23S rRNA (pseudouridine1915-N3)-methyltransferase
MRIAVLTVGRCRNAHLREGAREYVSRIGRYAALEEIEVREQKVAKGLPVEEVLRREGERLLRVVPEGSFVIALDRNGESCRSEDLAKRLSDLGLSGKSRLAFVVGGAFGLDGQVLERADWRLSLSEMTLPHEMARLVLLEQIYRAFTILRGEDYHK